MSSLSFPIQNVRTVALTNEFPTTAHTHDATQWRRFMATYLASSTGSSVSIVAPDDCMLYILTRFNVSVSSDHTQDYWIALEPIYPSRWQSTYLQGREPLLTTWFIGFSTLADRAVRHRIASDAVTRNLDRGTVRGETDSDGLLVRTSSWLSSGETASARAERLLEEFWDRGRASFPLYVRRNDVIANVSGHSRPLEIGAAYIPRLGNPSEAAVNRPFYWYDAHTLLQRLTAGSALGGSRFDSSPIEGTPPLDALKCWFEMRTPAEARVIRLESSSPRVVVSNPPGDEPIPLEIAELGAGDEPITVTVAVPGREWSVKWSADGETWRPSDQHSLRSREDPAVAEVSLTLSDIPFEWRGRTDPLRVAVNAGTEPAATQFYAQRDLVALARYRAEQVFAQQREIENFLGRDDNALRLQLSQKIDLIINAMPEAQRDDLRALFRDAGVDRRDVFETPYYRKAGELARRVARLGEVWNSPDCMLQIENRGLESDLLLIKKIALALHTTSDGVEAWRRQVKGFLFPELRMSGEGEAVFTADRFKEVWKINRRWRKHLASVLIDFVEADVELKVINAMRRNWVVNPGAVTEELRLLQNRFVLLFGGHLESVIVRTEDIRIPRGRPFFPDLIVPTFRFDDWPSEDSYTGAAARSSMSGLTLKGLNLIYPFYNSIVTTQMYLGSLGELNRRGLVPIIEQLRFAETWTSFVGDCADYWLRMGETHGEYRHLFYRELDIFEDDTGRRVSPASMASWSTTGKVLGVIGGTLSLVKSMGDVRSQFVQGDHTRGYWLTTAMVGSAIGLGISVATALAWDPPVAIALGIAAAALELIGQMGAAAFGFTALQLDFVHTVWGRQYEDLVGASENDRHEWHPSAGADYLSLQVAHLNGYLFPIEEAAMVVDETVVPPQLKIHGKVTSCRDGALVILQLWPSARLSVTGRLTFSFTIRIGDGAAVTRYGFRYLARPHARGVEVSVLFDALPGSAIAGIPVRDLDKCALAVSLHGAPAALLSGVHAIAETELARTYACMSRTYISKTSR